MKTKLMIISVLTAACIFVFSGATWADSKKDRRNKKPKKTHYTVAKHAKPDHHQKHWKKSGPYHAKNHRYHQRFYQRNKYHLPGIPKRYYRYKPYCRHFHKHGWHYKPHHKIQRPVKKYHRPKHHRPVYSSTHGKVSVLASTSHHGWSIKISSRD